jgi:hypothetical protein
MNTLLSCLFVLSVGPGQIHAERMAVPAEINQLAIRCYEGFDYSPSGSTLFGKSGGEGFEGGWIAAGFNARNPKAYTIAAGSLASSKLAEGQGYVRTEASPHVEHLGFGDLFPPMTYQAIKGIGRRLAVVIDDDKTTTFYVAALFRPEAAAGEKLFGGYVGFYLDGTGDHDLFVGTGADNRPEYRLATRGGSGKVWSQHRAEIGRTDLLVIKAELRADADVFTLYVNPDTREKEPTIGTVKRDLDVGSVDQLVLYSTGAFSIDEFRIVDAFSELAVYPSVDELRRIQNGKTHEGAK